MMTTSESRCAICGLEQGELTWPPSRTAAFAAVFAVVAFAVLYPLGRLAFRTGIVVALAVSIIGATIVGMRIWRTTQSYRLDFTGTEGRLTFSGQVGQFTWASVTATRPKWTVLGRGRQVILDTGIVLRSSKRVKARRGITVLDAALRKAAPLARTHLEHVLASR